MNRPAWLAGPPEGVVAVPDAVRALALGRLVEPVWQNQVGGITWRIGTPAELYVKWQPLRGQVSAGADLVAEHDRLRWLAPHAAVPTPVDRGSDRDGEWLATRALPGTNAVHDRWRADPAPAVRAIAVGLRRFHDSVPVEACPFDWSVDERLARAGLRPGTKPDIGPAPSVDRLVVCHGDACAPNTLVDDEGTFVAHVDLGTAGVADRWADLAVGSMSLGWNFGPGWEDTYFRAYGVDRDEERIAFHRRLWDAT